MIYPYTGSLIELKKLSEIEVWQIVKEWYTTGYYKENLIDLVGYDLEDICIENLELLIKSQTE
jgi:hypothetical protein